MTAADIALLLSRARRARGWPRAATTVVATLATIVLANWVIAAVQVGGPMGLGLTDSVQRLGTMRRRCSAWPISLRNWRGMRSR